MSTMSADDIRALRRSLGLTQAELAQRLNLSREAITQWETGRASPSGPAEMLLRAMQATIPDAGPISPDPGLTPTP